MYSIVQSCRQWKHYILGKRRQSSTLITSLYSSSRHRGSCRMTAIKSHPHICKNSISTSSIRQGAQIVSLTASVDLLWMNSPSCSILMGMRHLSGPNFISDILTSPPPIISWVQAQMSPIFTFKMDCYSIWATSVFLQVSLQR
jgi:hypothetical protein